MSNVTPRENSISPRLTSLNAEQYALEGCLSFYTVLPIHQEFMLKLTTMTQATTSLVEMMNVSIDLARIDAVDASALAMFIGWTREARARKVKISFCNASQSLLAMARISRLERLF